MSRKTLTAVLTLIALFIGTPRAAAKDIWAVLEEFSGPGPFRGGSFGATVCFGGDDGIETSPRLSQDQDGSVRQLWCAHGDRGKFAADPSGDFPRIEIILTEFGANRRFHSGFDAGMSVGWMEFVTDRGSKVNWVFTPVRLTLRPLMFLREPKKWFGVFNLYAKVPWVFGDITGEHFGAAPEAFNSQGEFVPSYGVTFDLGALIP